MTPTASRNAPESRNHRFWGYANPGSPLDHGSTAFLRSRFRPDPREKPAYPLVNIGRLLTAQVLLGNAYRQGRGVPRDPVQAVQWYTEAAQKGDPNGQAYLGRAYQNGFGVKEDSAAAVLWLRKAAEQGDATAQHELGMAYFDGYGTDRDAREAVKWQRLAAEQGYAPAQFQLGYQFYIGQGVAQDYEEAVNWYRKAAEQDDHEAQLMLSLMYYGGKGTPQDDTQALMWAILASVDGNSVAVNFRDKASADMKPAQISKSQKLAREWKPATGQTSK